MEYTELELKVIEAIGGVLNYESLESNINDNATGLEITETCEITGLDAKQVRGIFSSLEQKGLMYLETCNMGATRYMQITEEGLREYYRLFENNTKEETNMSVKVMEKATGNKFIAKKIDGGYEIFTLGGERYKKLKDSTFKKYFRIVEETADQPKEQPEPKAKEPVKELTGEEREKMLEKIRKILKLAEGNPSIEEGMAAALQAQKLMAKYNIHQDEVEWEEVKDEISSIFVEQIERRVLMAWRKQLALIIGKNFRCKVYMKGNATAFRGYKQDTKIAAEVYKSLYIIGDKLAMKEQARIQKATGSGKGMYNSYIAGFLKGVSEGFDEQCTALMIITPKEVEEEYKVFAAAHLKEKKTKGLTVINGEAYAKGKVDGKNAVKSSQIEKKGGN